MQRRRGGAQSFGALGERWAVEVFGDGQRLVDVFGDVGVVVVVQVLGAVEEALGEVVGGAVLAQHGDGVGELCCGAGIVVGGGEAGADEGEFGAVHGGHRAGGEVGARSASVASMSKRARWWAVRAASGQVHVAYSPPNGIPVPRCSMPAIARRSAWS